MSYSVRLYNRPFLGDYPTLVEAFGILAEAMRSASYVRALRGGITVVRANRPAELWPEPWVPSRPKPRPPLRLVHGGR